MNAIGARNAWRAMSQSSHVAMAQAMSASLSGESAVAGEERVPVMAGSLNTGYYIGDRVKTTLRLPHRDEKGHDPSDPTERECGIVQGPGRAQGEIMVKFEGSGTVSIKVGQLEHVHAKKPQTNLDRSRCRKSHISHYNTVM